MNHTGKNVTKTLISAVVGGGVGAGAYSVIGGIGIAVGGTAVGVTVGPFVVIGAGLGAAAYGLVWLGKQLEVISKLL